MPSVYPILAGAIHSRSTHTLWPVCGDVRNMKIDADLDLLPIDGERLTASRFLELVKNNPGLIKRSRIVLPKLGEDGFGSFDVVYSRPIYKTKWEVEGCQGDRAETTRSPTTSSSTRRYRPYRMTP